MTTSPAHDSFIISEFSGDSWILTPQSEINVPITKLPPFPDYTYPPNNQPVSTSRNDYLHGAEEIIDALKEYPECKVVYSRVLVTDRRFNSLSERFAELCNRYPQAYVFCYSTPQTGTWIGASPELLCKKNGRVVESMALAGTKRRDDTSPWDKKNIEEQAFVAQFIAERFRMVGIDAEQSPTETLAAGPVKHLCTRFTSRGNASPAAAMRLPWLLAPTPALCGTPREYALEMISRYEAHRRGCYGGFMGRITTTGDYVFWVNLRCMQLFDRRVALYVGGGLTHLSVATDEWEETAAKALTLA